MRIDRQISPLQCACNTATEWVLIMTLAVMAQIVCRNDLYPVEAEDLLYFTGSHMVVSKAR